MKEKRHFKRIPMDGPVELACTGRQWQSRLLDISLKGALIVTPADWETVSAAECELSLRLDDAIVITMRGAVVHAGNRHLGFRCDHIGLESISHLKRLIELNLGDEALLERELSELTHSND